MLAISFNGRASAHVQERLRQLLVRLLSGGPSALRVSV